MPREAKSKNTNAIEWAMRIGLSNKEKKKTLSCAVGKFKMSTSSHLCYMTPTPTTRELPVSFFRTNKSLNTSKKSASHNVSFLSPVHKLKVPSGKLAPSPYRLTLLVRCPRHPKHPDFFASETVRERERERERTSTIHLVQNERNRYKRHTQEGPMSNSPTRRPNCHKSPSRTKGTPGRTRSS